MFFMLCECELYLHANSFYFILSVVRYFREAASSSLFTVLFGGRGSPLRNQQTWVIYTGLNFEKRAHKPKQKQNNKAQTKSKTVVRLWVRV